MILATHGIISSYVGVDIDAQAFITATGITDTTQKSAINKLVLDLKSYSIWAKFKAIYPFVGGTATTHKFNLKDPRDLDVAFRLSFINGWTHSSTGAKPNGTDAYANTFLTPLGTLSQNSTHVSIYSRTDNNNTTPLISDQAGLSDVLNIFPRYSGSNDVYIRVNSSPTASLTTKSTSTGLYVANRVSSSETRNNINNTLYTQSSTSTGLNSSSIWLSRQGGGYDNREQAFASLGNGLTDTDASNFYNAVNAYQVALSRNV